MGNNRHSASASALRADDQVFDYRAALARVDGDEEFFCELVEMFVHDGPDRLAAIETALDAEALAELAQLAHKLRGSACHFMATATVAAAQALETASDRGNLAQATSACGELARELERLLGRLRATLAFAR